MKIRNKWSAVYCLMKTRKKIKQMTETMWNYRTGKMIENDKTETKKGNKETRKEKDNKQKRL